MWPLALMGLGTLGGLGLQWKGNLTAEKQQEELQNQINQQNARNKLILIAVVVLLILCLLFIVKRR